MAHDGHSVRSAHVEWDGGAVCLVINLENGDSKRLYRRNLADVRRLLDRQARRLGLVPSEDGDAAYAPSLAEARALCDWVGGLLPNGPTAGGFVRRETELVRAVELIVERVRNYAPGTFTKPQDRATMDRETTTEDGPRCQNR